ncbi:hypothetical protein V1512DRAFT_265225 [Lipomyces arxii]|uniref:uncharacterized protein n=1 Tax=Lipomyces arxii TaxID=56418 RepID=UPI0034CD9CF9
MSLFSPAYSLTQSRRSSAVIVPSSKVSPKTSTLFTGNVRIESLYRSASSTDFSAPTSALGSQNVSDSESTPSQFHASHNESRSRKHKSRTHKQFPVQNSWKVYDGVKDGYNKGFRKKCVESCLILGLLALAVRHNWETVVLNTTFIGAFFAVLITILLLRQNYWTMPSVLYIYLFPISLTLADYPQYLRLNILLSLSSLPMPGELLSNIVITFSPQTPEVYYLYSSITDIVGTLTTTSLSPAETSLAGTLLVNLLLNAKQMDMIFLRAFLFGSLFSLWPSLHFVHAVMDIARLPRHRRPANSDALKLRYGCAVYIIFVSNIMLFVRWHLAKVLSQDPFAYMVNYLFFSEQSGRRMGMLAYWSTWLLAGIPWIQKSSAAWTIDIRRKVWHGMVVGMFLAGGVGFDAIFTSLSMAIALTLFLFSEFLRATTLPPLGSAIHEALRRYTDERDTCGPIIVSHIFLLLGISLPIFWSSSPAGIICLGFGDACASIIGRRFGKHRWFDSKKTLEGTAAFVVAAFTGLMLTKYVLIGYDEILGHDLSIPWALLVATSTAVLEATSGMNDNVIVPVYMYVVLRLGTHSSIP